MAYKIDGFVFSRITGTGADRQPEHISEENEYMLVGEISDRINDDPDLGIEIPNVDLYYLDRILMLRAIRRAYDKRVLQNDSPNVV